LSHDEVVHGKGSLIRKMPGDEWQKFANLRLLYAGMYTQPGKKLLFMGGEFGQWSEWNQERSLDWHLLEMPLNAGLMQLVGDLNRLYQEEPSLHELDVDPKGFDWVDCSDADNSILVYQRYDRQRSPILMIMNYTPLVRHAYRVGVPVSGRWNERINTDADVYGGSGVGNGCALLTEPVAMHGFEQSVCVTIPPLGALILQPEDPAAL
ncbi:MAG: alpha amylase C-terminal domain-containing protein, partial [Myxococcota bacterium]